MLIGRRRAHQQARRRNSRSDNHPFARHPFELSLGGVLSLITILLLLPGCATTGTGGSPAQSPRSAPSPPPSGTAGVGIGVGTGGVRVGGAVSPSTSDPVAHSIMMGFMIGAVAGPIGALVGAGVGYLRGLSVKKEQEQQVQVEVDKLKKLDDELERQILAQRAGGAAGAPGPKPAPASEQGVIIVKDHLADEQNPQGGATAGGGPESGVAVVTDHLRQAEPERAAGAGVPPPLAAGLPASPQGPMPARVPSDGLDSEGFKAVYEGGRLVRRERDLNGDGKSDVILYYDSDGQLTRREESSQLDGRIDTRTYYADGRMERKESDTDRDGKADLWAYYNPQGDLIRLESLVDRGRKLTQFFAEGKVVREEWRREADGQLEVRLTYQDGKVTQKEEDTTGSGRLTLVSIFNDAGQLVKQGRRGEDGRILAWRYVNPDGKPLREEEIGKDGTPVAVSYYDNGRLARRELYELDDRLFKRAPLVLESPPTGKR